MKARVSVACAECGRNNEIKVVVGHELPDVHCDCGATIFGVGEVDVAHGILSCAQDEIAGADYPLAIVFAATAVDCELSRLYVKWRRIDAALADSSLDDEALEEELRRQTRIREKLDTVAQLLVSQTLDGFCVTNAATAKSISRAVNDEILIPSLRQNVEQRLFWKRNRVLHFGRVDYTESDAAGCLKIAGAMIHTYLTMDFERRKQLDTKLSNR